MENVILTIHLLIALILIGIVLLQRSEGGGLGIGGGGGNATTGRASGNALTRVTWILAIGFLVTSLTLTILATREASNSSVIDTVPVAEGGDAAPVPALPDLEDVLTPTLPGDGPSLPPTPE